MIMFLECNNWNDIIYILSVRSCVRATLSLACTTGDSSKWTNLFNWKHRFSLGTSRWRPPCLLHDLQGLDVVATALADRLIYCESDVDTPGKLLLTECDLAPQYEALWSYQAWPFHWSVNAVMPLMAVSCTLRWPADDPWVSDRVEQRQCSCA